MTNWQNIFSVPKAWGAENCTVEKLCKRALAPWRGSKSQHKIGSSGHEVVATRIQDLNAQRPSTASSPQRDPSWMTRGRRQEEPSLNRGAKIDFESRDPDGKSCGKRAAGLAKIIVLECSLHSNASPTNPDLDHDQFGIETRPNYFEYSTKVPANRKAIQRER